MHSTEGTIENEDLEEELGDQRKIPLAEILEIYPKLNLRKKDIHTAAIGENVPDEPYIDI